MTAREPAVWPWNGQAQYPPEPACICVSVDIDAITHYYAIHGLAEEASSECDPVWSYGVGRFLDLFAQLNLRATFFVVASDLVPASEGGRVHEMAVVHKRHELVRQMTEKGHEVASHSFGHDYALSRRSGHEMQVDLQLARDVLYDVTGRRALGFRAPGYILSHRLVAAVKASGAAYSSSWFPSPPYFLAKWLTMCKLALAGHRSRSIAGPIMAPFGPRRIHRHPGGLLELPISVISVLRLPAIGTFFVLYGDHGQRWLMPRLAKERWLNLEFHGIDLVDPSDPGIGQDLRRRQFDLRVSLTRKASLIEDWLAHLAEERVNLTLDEVAQRYG